jgi:hypothetical protein
LRKIKAIGCRLQESGLVLPDIVRIPRAPMHLVQNKRHDLAGTVPYTRIHQNGNKGFEAVRSPRAVAPQKHEGFTTLRTTTRQP